MNLASGIKQEQTSSVHGLAPMADEQGEQHFYVTASSSHAHQHRNPPQTNHQLNPQPQPPQPQPQPQPILQHQFQQPTQHFHQSHLLHQPHPHVQHLHQQQNHQQPHFPQQTTLHSHHTRPPNIQPLHHQHSHLHHHQHLLQSQHHQQPQIQQQHHQHQHQSIPHLLFDNNSLQDTRQLHAPPTINQHQVRLEIERIEIEIKSITESITDGSLSFTDKNIRNLLINLNTNLRNQQNILAKFTTRHSSATQISSPQHPYQHIPPQHYRHPSSTPLQTVTSQQHQPQTHAHSLQPQSQPLLQSPLPPQPQCIQQPHPQPQTLLQPHPHTVPQPQPPIQIHQQTIQQPPQKPQLMPRQEPHLLETVTPSLPTKILSGSCQFTEKQTVLTDCSEVITISSSDDAEDEVENQTVPTVLNSVAPHNQTPLVDESSFDQMEKLSQPHLQPRPQPSEQPSPARQPSPQPSEQPHSPKHPSPQPCKQPLTYEPQEISKQPQPHRGEQPQQHHSEQLQPSKQTSPQPSEQSRPATQCSPRPSKQPAPKLNKQTSPQPSEQPTKQPHPQSSVQSQHSSHQQQQPKHVPQTPKKKKKKKNKNKKNKNKHQDRKQSRNMIEPKRESQSGSVDRHRASNSYSQQARGAVLHEYRSSRQRKKRIKRHSPLSNHARLRSRGFHKLCSITNHRNNERGVTLFDVIMQNGDNRREKCELIASELIKFSYKKVYDYIIDLKPHRKSCMIIWSPIITLIADYPDYHEPVIKEIKRLQHEMVKISKKAKSKIYPDRSIKMRILREKRSLKLEECQARLRERGLVPTSSRLSHQHRQRTRPRSPSPSQTYKPRPRSRSKSPRRQDGDFLLEGMQRVKREH